MTLKELKRELNRLYMAEEKLLDFLMYTPEHQKETVKKIFEVASLIISMEKIIKETERNSKTDD